MDEAACSVPTVTQPNGGFNLVHRLTGHRQKNTRSLWHGQIFIELQHFHPSSVSLYVLEKAVTVL